jgi:hypothetical protein
VIAGMDRMNLALLRLRYGRVVQIGRIGSCGLDCHPSSPQVDSQEPPCAALFGFIVKMQV